jgi:hypothetical protein
MAIVKDGVPTGEYEDFVTGFVIDDASVWGRPVGGTQAKDGALIFSEDGKGTLWRVSRTSRASANQGSSEWRIANREWRHYISCHSPFDVRNGSPYAAPTPHQA